MGTGTEISWADHTWNPWWGCTKVSTGEKGACELCYAEGIAHRFGVGFGPHADRRVNGAAHWALPAQWNRQALRAGVRPFVFCLSMGDIWDKKIGPDLRRRALNVMRDTPQLIWLLLSKRIGNAEDMVEDCGGGLPPNCALGISAGHQDELHRDAWKLFTAAMRLRAAFTFLSYEPALGPLNLERVRIEPGGSGGTVYANLVSGSAASIGGTMAGPRLDWVIAGGESGPKARPSSPQWFVDVRNQCARGGVPFHFKQWGAWAPISMTNIRPGRPLQQFGPYVVARVGDKKKTGRLLEGNLHDARPAVAALAEVA